MKKFTLLPLLIMSFLITSCGPGKKGGSEPSKVGAGVANQDTTNNEDGAADEAPAPEVISPRYYDDVGEFVRVKNSNYNNNLPQGSTTNPPSSSGGSSSGSPEDSSSTGSPSTGAPGEGSVVSKPPAFIEAPPEYVVSGEKKYPIKRERLKLKNVKYNYDINSKTMDLNGDVYFNDQQGRYFQLKGTYSKGFIPLAVQDSKSELKNLFKAKVTCVSAADQEVDCKEFYVDFFYLSQGVIYTDQLIPKATVQNIQSAGRPAPGTQEQFSDAPNPQADASADTEVGSDDGAENEVESVDVEEDEGGFFSGDTQGNVVDLFPNLKLETPKPPAVVPPKTGGSATPPPSAKPGAKPGKPTVPPVRTPPPKPGTAPTPPPVVVSPLPAGSDEFLNPSIFEISNRSKDQAIGKPSAGRLQNSSSLVDVLNRLSAAFQFQIFSRVVSQKKFFGTFDMMVIIENVVKWVKKNFPGQLVSVGNVAKQKGGDTDGRGGQVSHQSGVDADIAYFTTNAKSEKMQYVVDFGKDKVTSDFLIDKQWALFKKIYATQAVDIIIVDPVIKIALCNRAVQTGELKNANTKALAASVLNRIYPDKKYYGKRRNKMHANHFHLRIKCGKYNPRCWQGATASKAWGLGCTVK